MEEPSPRGSRLALAGAILAILLVGGGGFLLGRGATERTPLVVARPIAAPAPAVVPAPLRGVLGRADLIALAASAADAAAAGRDPAREIAQADGRRFELRLPFGCHGPAAQDSDAAMRWSYDEGAKALRIHVEPVRWSAEDWWAGDAATGVEAIEGFWVAHPWTSSEVCPAEGEQLAPAGADPVTLPGQTLALGQVILADQTRSGARGSKPYEAVVRVPEDALRTAQGFRLRMTGRIARARGATPISCHQPAGPEQRPLCLVSVVLDEVAIENPASGETLATWNVAGRDAPGG